MHDPIFQRTLQDLIKGIRNHKRDPSGFISQAIVDIKNELKAIDTYVKAEAVRKLTYLQMIGYNVSWASFSIIEVMSQPRFAHKRIGYLAANQTFDDSTDLLLLTTNLFKKELANPNYYEIGLAINCLANIANKELARDCMSDLVSLMTHSKSYIRKKTILALYKLFIKYPQGLKLCFEKLKEKLDDPDISVVSTAVNVICELANKNPKNYLALAPIFFKLLTTSSNNWMLIKVVKLLSSLVKEEPRLARKLLEPLATIIQNTGAKSLKYECIYAITEALPYSKREDGSEPKAAGAVTKLCSDYLRSFLEESDQNLKYLGLVGFCNLLKSNQKSVIDNRDLILKCLNDEDITIQKKALELLVGIVSKKSFVELVKHLLEYARRIEGLFRDEIISKILMMGKHNKYEMVIDFAWYISALLDLAVMHGLNHGTEVAEQLIEVAIRVDKVRPFLVESMLSLILNHSLFFGQARATVAEVLRAAAWIIGEYSEVISAIYRDKDKDTEEGTYWIEGIFGEEMRSKWHGRPLHISIMETLLDPKSTNLSFSVQIVYLQAVLKVFIRACGDCENSEIFSCVYILKKSLPVFLQSSNLEVQERASTLRQILIEFRLISSKEEVDSSFFQSEKSFLPFPDGTLTDEEDWVFGAKKSSQTLRSFIAEPFYAVHSKAQKKVPLPADLDIDSAFNAKSFSKLLDYALPERGNSSSITLFATFKSVPEEAAFKLEVSQEDVQHVNPSVTDSQQRVDDIFILSRKSESSSLFAALAPSEVKPDAQKHNRKTAKSKKRVDVDLREMLPAGALSSEDEEKKQKRDKGKNNSRNSEASKKKTKTKRSKEENSKIKSQRKSNKETLISHEILS